MVAFKGKPALKIELLNTFYTKLDCPDWSLQGVGEVRTKPTCGAAMLLICLRDDFDPNILCFVPPPILYAVAPMNWRIFS